MSKNPKLATSDQVSCGDDILFKLGSHSFLFVICVCIFLGFKHWSNKHILGLVTFLYNWISGPVNFLSEIQTL